MLRRPRYGFGTTTISFNKIVRTYVSSPACPLNGVNIRVSVVRGEAQDVIVVDAALLDRVVLDADADLLRPRRRGDTTSTTGSAVPEPPGANSALFARTSHLVVAGPPTLDRVSAALGAGARGYLFPPLTPIPHPPAPSMTVARRTDPEAVPQQQHDSPPAISVEAADGSPSHLSAREVEIVQLVADGMNNIEIGQLLGLSALTVKSHLARITARLRAADRAHIVLLALRARVIR